jgi:hypothetical protein
VRDEHVAGVGAGRDGAEDEPRRERGGQVLQRVHGAVDAAVLQRLLDLLHEEALAARGRERPLLQAVAGRSNGHQLGREIGMRRRQRVAHVPGLGQRERAAAGPDAERAGRHRQASSSSRLDVGVAASAVSSGGGSSWKSARAAST